MIRQVLMLGLLLAAQPVAALTFPWSKADEETQVDLPPRPIVSVVVADLPEQRRSFPGVVAAGIEVQLGFQTLGRLSSRPVDVGDMVATGDVLAELAPEDLQDNVRAARAAVETAEVTLETAQATAERTRDLARRSVASQATLEQAERGLRAAEAGLDQARSELARAEDAEGFARLIAPFDGVVSAVFENTGAVVEAGVPVLTLSEVATREAVIDLPEAVLLALPVGTEAIVWLESEPHTRSTGRISRIDPLADAATRTRRVHVEMDDPGSFRLNSLIRAQRAGAAGSLLVLPETAIAGTAEDPAVWVVTRQGDAATVSRRAVTVGLAMNGEVEVTSGIVPGDEIVVRGVNSLTEGQEVGRQVEP